MTDKDGWVLDPFLGSGTSLPAALKHGRRAAGAEISREYINIAHERISQLKSGSLKCRPMSAPIYDPAKPGGGLRHKIWTKTRRLNPAKTQAQPKSLRLRGSWAFIKPCNYGFFSKASKLKAFAACGMLSRGKKFGAGAPLSRSFLLKSFPHAQKKAENFLIFFKCQKYTESCVIK